MPYVPATCPNCGGDLRIDSDAEKGYCIHCGSLISFLEAVRNVHLDGPIEMEGYVSYPTLIKLIETDLKNGTNQTPEFKQHLIKAMELDPDNQYLYGLVKSQIWKAEICDGVLVRYDGSADKVMVPNGITAIGKLAFGRSHSLKEITLPKSVNQIGEGAFIYESQLTINAYKGSFAARYAISSPATLNILDYKTDSEKHISTIDGILRELDNYKKSTVASIEAHFEKAYSINWTLVFAVLIIPIALLLIGLKIDFSSEFITISSILFIFLFVFIASPVLIIKSGYSEIRKKIAVKMQTTLFIKMCSDLLNPLGIVDFKYSRNIFDENYNDLESEVIRLQSARDKIINMDKKLLYKKPYIYYTLIDYLKGENPKEYD